MFAVQQLDHGSAGRDLSAGSDPLLREIEHPLPGVGSGDLLAHQWLLVTPEASGQLHQLLRAPGAGSSADGGPFAGEHRSEDCPRVPELPDERLFGNERVLQEYFVEVVGA